jgi:hypothetical protein
LKRKKWKERHGVLVLREIGNGIQHTYFREAQGSAVVVASQAGKASASVNEEETDEKDDVGAGAMSSGLTK